MKYILLLLALFANFFAPAQNIAKDSSVPVVAYWPKGVVKKLVISKTTSQKSEGKTTNTSNTSEATFKVLDSTETSYTIEWTYTSVNKMASLYNLNAFLEGIRIVYQTDELGSFTSLVNFEEVQKLVLESYEKLKKQAAGSADEMDGSLIEQVADAFKKREGIEQVILRDIALYHTPYGVEYSFTKNIQEGLLPNFLGGDPWPILLYIALDKLDVKRDVAQVSILQEIDNAKAGAIMREFTKRIAAGADVQIKDEDLPSQFLMNDKNIFDVELSTGWIKKIYLSRVAKFGDMEKTDITQITMK